MPRRRLSIAVLLSLIVVSVAGGLPILWCVDSAPTLLAAQATGSTVSPAQAAPYIGDWTAPITSQMGPMTFAVSVKAEGGKVAASVSGGMFPPATVSDISLVGQNLFLKYVSEVQGMSIPGLVAMTPQGPNMLLTISILDGQLEMAGTPRRAARRVEAGRRQAVGPDAARRRRLRARAVGPQRNRRWLASAT